MEKIMLHCDMNNYYASVESLYRPELRRVPMAVVGDPAMRHGIILAKNDIAKKLGVVTGESIFSAKQKVPNLTTVIADYPKYVHFAKEARKLYSEYSSDVAHFGLDESWIDLTGKVDNIAAGARTADDIRARVKSELGLTISVGVSFNYIFSKLASDMKKPDATTVLTKNDLQSVIWKLPVFELLFVGAATRKKLAGTGILTIGDLANTNVKLLKQKLGKNGETLWCFANGDDSGFDPRTPENDPFKSIGNSVTMPYDLVKELDILTMLFVLSKTVSARLKKHKVKAACVSVLIKYGDFEKINRQLSLNIPVDNECDLYKNAKRLFLGNYDKNKPVRSIGIHTSKLVGNRYEQLTLFDDAPCEITEITEIERNLQGKMKELKIEKYFNFNFMEGQKCADGI